MNQDQLKDCPPDEFVEYVRLAISEDDEAVWNQLFEPGLIHRTRAALVAVLQDVESQLSRISTRKGTGREKSLWRSKAIGYLRRIQDRLQQLKIVMAAAEPHRYVPPGQPPGVNADKAAQNLSTLFELSAAVARHEQVFRSMGVAPEFNDLELWGHLNFLEVFHTEHGLRPLRDWISAGAGGGSDAPA